MIMDIWYDVNLFMVGVLSSLVLHDAEVRDQAAGEHLHSRDILRKILDLSQLCGLTKRFFYHLR